MSTSDSVEIVLDTFRAVERRDDHRLRELFHPEMSFIRRRRSPTVDRRAARSRPARLALVGRLGSAAAHRGGATHESARRGRERGRGRCAQAPARGQPERRAVRRGGARPLPKRGTGSSRAQMFHFDYRGRASASPSLPSSCGAFARPSRGASSSSVCSCRGAELSRFGGSATRCRDVDGKLP